MASRDYYEVLGVSRDAEQEDLRKAFRKLARQHHPDMHGGDADAGERFKEINQAYEVLSNPEKRSRYDRFGAAGVAGNGAGPGGDFGSGGAGFGNFTDIFDVFFGAAAGGTVERGQERGADLRFDLEVTLEEVLTGVQKTITIQRQERCAGCGGTGAKAGTKPQKCVVCGGAGAVRQQRKTMFGVMSQVSECYRCHGRGEIILDPCARCHGRGLERRPLEVLLRVPPGVGEGVQLRIPNSGDAGPNAGSYGDLYTFIHVKQHPTFRRREAQLSCEVEVSFTRAALGGDVEVPTLEGPVTRTIHAGTQSGDVFRISKRGLPHLNNPTVRGEQQVTVRVRTPTHLNDRQRAALNEFAAASGEDLGHTAAGAQHEKGFFDWVRNLFSDHEGDSQGNQGREK